MIKIGKANIPYLFSPASAVTVLEFILPESFGARKVFTIFAA